METKRSLLILLSILLTLSLCTPAFAAEAAKTAETVIDLGNGYYVVETITEYSLTRADGKKFGQKTHNFYHGSDLVGTATLYASFEISGTSVSATSASISGTGAYTRGTTRCSGNTAYGTAYFLCNGVEYSVPLSLSCSPDGVLS